MRTFITYRKNPDYSPGSEQPKVYANLDLRPFGADAQVENLPVYYRMLTEPVGPIRVVYSTCIAGLPIETGNLQRLEKVLNDILRSLIRFASLPEYVFQLDENAWPIYAVDDQLVTRYPGGPVFSAEDIAGLRVWLGEHFKGIGRIEHRREMGLLHLSPFNLQLYAPFCVLRAPREDIADIPVFPSPYAHSFNLIAPVGRSSLTVPFQDGMGVFSLHSMVGDLLVEQGQLDTPLGVTIRKLLLEDWERMRPELTPLPYRLEYERQREEGARREFLPVFEHDGSLVAARTNRVARVVLYIAQDLNTLERLSGEDLYRYGSITSVQEVQAVPARSKSDTSSKQLTGTPLMSPSMES
jgi:hypothetical protein